MDVGLLILRLLVAGILYAHATQKALGWFSGQGLVGAAATFERSGHRPGRTMVIIAATCEATAAVLLLLGLATPVGAAIAAGTMLVAGVTAVRASGTFWTVQGGGEFAFVLAGCAVALGFTGAGAFSLDRVIGGRWYGASDGTAITIGVGAAALALLTSIPPLLRSGRSAPEGASTTTSPTGTPR